MTNLLHNAVINSYKNKYIDQMIAELETETLDIANNEDSSYRVFLQLLNRLNETRYENSKFNFFLADCLFENDKYKMEKVNNSIEGNLNEEQKLAIKRVLINNVSYIHAPVKIEKTNFLSTLVDNLINNGKTILLVSNTLEELENDLLKIIEKVNEKSNFSSGDFLTLCPIIKKELLDLESLISFEDILELNEREELHQKNLLIEREKKCRYNIETSEKLVKSGETNLWNQTIINITNSRIEKLEQDKNHCKLKLEEIKGKNKELLNRLKRLKLLSLIKKRFKSDIVKLNREIEINYRNINYHNEKIDEIEKSIKINDALAVTIKQKELKERKNNNGVVREQILNNYKKELENIHKEKEELDRKIKLFRMKILSQSKIIGTTVSQLFSSKYNFFLKAFDVIIIDEVSTLEIPFLYYLCGMGKEKVVFIGEINEDHIPRLSNGKFSKSWTNKNVFNKNYIYELLDWEQRSDYIIDLTFLLDDINNPMNEVVINTELSSIDELFLKTEKYRNSKEFIDLLKFISKFKKYSPYNCMLMHIQNPNITYVASINDWERNFGRYPKKEARPLVILQPFGPVMFLFDVLDTYGRDVPEEVIRPFKTDGEFPTGFYTNLLENSKFLGIENCLESKSNKEAGYAKRILRNDVIDYRQEKPVLRNNYKIVINSNLIETDLFSTCIHELAHVICGHLGMDPINWWDDRSEYSKQTKEIEAETVAYLVCNRIGLVTTSEKYLVSYKNRSLTKLPEISVNAIFHAVEFIESMGEKKWKKNKREPKKNRPFRKIY